MCQVHTETSGLCPELCHASPTKFSTAHTPCLARAYRPPDLFGDGTKSNSTPKTGMVERILCIWGPKFSLCTCLALLDVNVWSAKQSKRSAERAENKSCARG